MRRIVFTRHARERAKERDLEYGAIKSVVYRAYVTKYKKYNKNGEFKLKFGSLMFVCVGSSIIRVLTIYRRV